MGSTMLADIDKIEVGDKVVVEGYAGSPNDVIWELFMAGTDSKIGESLFHLSCSDADMNGPEVCNKPMGNSKMNETGWINEWLFAGMAGNGQTLDCFPTPPEPTDNCAASLSPNPSCAALKAAGQKLTSITFRYTGGGCAARDNDQTVDKTYCSGSINPSDKVTVIAASKDGKIKYPLTQSSLRGWGIRRVRRRFRGRLSVPLEQYRRDGNGRDPYLLVHSRWRQGMSSAASRWWP